MNIKFLFWNIQGNKGKRNIQENVANIAKKHTIDVIILAEDKDNTSIIRELNTPQVVYSYIPNPNPKITFYTKLPKSNITKIDSKLTRVNFYKLSTPNMSILIVGIHFLCKTTYREEDTAKTEVERIVEEIKKIQKQENCIQTIIVGDFNMNPFEIPMVRSKCFHAIMDKKKQWKKHELSMVKHILFFIILCGVLWVI